MARTLVLAYGLFAYVMFVATFLYAIGFVGDFGVPRTVDRANRAPLAQSVVINVLLLGLFGLQHSVMARRGFKQWWTRFVPTPIERSTFVLFSNLVLLLLFWQWRELPAVIWHVEMPVVRAVLYAVFAAGWGLVLAASCMIDHFDLFGLRQTYLYWRGQPYTPPPFQITVLYRWVRHPLMLGFLIAFWATPSMTAGHLLFAGVTTGYILIAIQIEERDLLRHHGASYAEYRERTSMLLPLPMRRGKTRGP